VVDNAWQNAESIESVTASDQQAEAGRSSSPAGQVSQAGTSRTSDAVATSGGRCEQSSANPIAAESSSDVSSTSKAGEKADAADETARKADAEEQSTQPGAPRAEDEEKNLNHPGLQSCAKAETKNRPASKVTSTDESGATSFQGDSGEHADACVTEFARPGMAAPASSSVLGPKMVSHSGATNAPKCGPNATDTAIPQPAPTQNTPPFHLQQIHSSTSKPKPQPPPPLPPWRSKVTTTTTTMAVQSHHSSLAQW